MRDVEKRKAYQREFSRRYRAAHPAETRATVDRYQKENAAAIKARRATHRRANKERLYAQTTEWRKANLGRARAAVRKWQKANKHRVNAHATARRTAKEQRTPVWADPLDIASVYEVAMVLSVSGVKYHVDHVIPLHGKLVSGLHVPDNLQVLPWYENLSKNNRFEVS